MTAHVPMMARPVNLASPSAGIGSALDRIAYVVLCAFVFSLPWADGVPMIGASLGLLGAGILALRTMVVRHARKPSPLHYWMVAFVGWVALSFLWTLDLASTGARVGTYLQLLTAVWLIWELA